MVNNVDHIVLPWKEYKKEGTSLFKFYLILALLTFLTFGLFIGLTYLTTKSSGAFESDFFWSFGTFFRLFTIPLILLIVGFIIYFKD